LDFVAASMVANRRSVAQITLKCQNDTCRFFRKL